MFPFWGLEYEDSYIFNDTARLMNSISEIDYSSYLTPSCLNGSYNYCYSYGTLGGHFLFFPFLISIVHKIFDYNVVNVFTLNMLFSIFGVISLLIYYKKGLLKELNFILYTLVLSLTPFVPLFNTSGLSETLSSFFVLFFLLNVFVSSNKEFKFERKKNSGRPIIEDFPDNYEPKTKIAQYIINLEKLENDFYNQYKK
mgnify:CR=1 FL=1